MTVSETAFVASLRRPVLRDEWLWRDAGGAAATAVNWSDELERVHEEVTADHFIDVWTRSALVQAIRSGVVPEVTVVDVGCSSGYLLRELRRAYDDVHLVGVDLVEAGLAAAHARVPEATLFLADATDLPFGDGTVDVVVSANVLEHVDDDAQVLGEIHRVLAPGGLAALVVPLGRSLYDDYDARLGHVRRYGRGEVAAKARAHGFGVEDETTIGALLFPAFWARKRLNRLLPHRSAADVDRRVRRQMLATRASRVGDGACRLEHALRRRGVSLPFGIRGITVLQRLG